MLRIPKIIIVIAALIILGTLVSTTANAASPTPSSQTQILTIMVRDSHGQPLAGATCEVLSSGWGNKPGQGITVIASGDTDQDGQVAFDATKWPHSIYSVNFKATDHMNPANTYFAPEYMKQSQAYAEAIFGGATETSYFVMGSDGKPYPDKAKGKGTPDYDTNAPGGNGGEGNIPPGYTPISGEAYLATAMAGTVHAAQFGTPNPTIPPPAAPTNSAPQGPLTTAVTATANNIKPNQAEPNVATILTAAPVATQIQTNLLATTTPPVATLIAGAANNQANNNNSGSGGGTGNTLTTLFSAFLAIVGLTCLILFLIYRQHIYKLMFTLMGVQTVERPSKPKKIKVKQAKAAIIKRPIAPGSNNNSNGGEGQSSSGQTTTTTSNIFGDKGGKK